MKNTVVINRQSINGVRSSQVKKGANTPDRDHIIHFLLVVRDGKTVITTRDSYLVDDVFYVYSQIVDGFSKTFGHLKKPLFQTTNMFVIFVDLLLGADRTFFGPFSPSEIVYKIGYKIQKSPSHFSLHSEFKIINYYLHIVVCSQKIEK